MKTNHTAKKLDARIVKTLAGIEQAFLTLLDQKDYNDITVQDILSYALINRTTFYKYYSNKDDLARFMVESIKRDFLDPIIESRINTPWETIAEETRLLVNDNHHNLKLLWKIKAPNVNLKKDVYALIKQKYQIAIKKENPTIKTNDLDFQAHIHASLGIAMIDYAVNEIDTPDPDCRHHQLRQVFERLSK